MFLDENVRPDVRARPHLPADVQVRPRGRGPAPAPTWRGRVRAGAGLRGPAWIRVARPRARADAVKRPRGLVAAQTRGHGGGQKN
jgi:hypothetical protein